MNIQKSNFTLDNLSEYSPSFGSSGVANEDADDVLRRIIEVPCGTDAVTYSEKNNNTRAVSFAGAGRLAVSSIVNEENKRRKLHAFGQRFPKDVSLVGYDDEVDARFKEFKDYTKTNDVRETVHILNCKKQVPVDVRNKVAKQVATIGNYTGLLTDDVAEKFSKGAFNYFLLKNPVFHAAVRANLDKFDDDIDETETETIS